MRDGPIQLLEISVAGRMLFSPNLSQIESRAVLRFFRFRCPVCWSKSMSCFSPSRELSWDREIPKSRTGLLPTAVFFEETAGSRVYFHAVISGFRQCCSPGYLRKSLYFTFRETVLPLTSARRIRRATLLAKDRISFLA